MPIYQNNTAKAIIVNRANAPGGVIDHHWISDELVAPGEKIFAQIGSEATGLTKLTGSETLKNVVASQVENIPYGRLTLKSGSDTYEFSALMHLMDNTAMTATNHEFYNKATECFVFENGLQNFQYTAKIIPNTLAAV